jgi:hypothetical protein
MNAHTGPPGKDAAPVVSGGGDVERLGGGYDVATLDHPPGIPRCEAASILCQVLGWLEREAAGRVRLCCRHFLDDEAVSA